MLPYPPNTQLAKAPPPSNPAILLPAPLPAPQWLLTDMRPGDSLVFHFSGHGSQKKDYAGDEEDGLDETILPTDYKTAGQIVDNDLNTMLIRPLAPGVTLHAVVDACHSGTVMDLAYTSSRDRSGRFSWKVHTN